jgi:hypothetical protein
MHKIRNFHRHSSVGECQGSGRVVAKSRQGNGRGTAWERHGMCESVLKRHILHTCGGAAGPLCRCCVYMKVGFTALHPHHLLRTVAVRTLHLLA